MLRHGVEESMVSWIVNVSVSTMSRIFVACVTLGAAVFSKINLEHPKELVINSMPKSYKDNGFSHAVLVLDATEFKLNKPSNLQLNFYFSQTIRTPTQQKAL